MGGKTSLIQLLLLNTSLVLYQETGRMLSPIQIVLLAITVVRYGGLAVALPADGQTVRVDNNHMQKPLYTEPWQTMPPPPPLPRSNYNGTVPINGIELWHATFGADLAETQANNEPPLVFLHGGYANSEYWSNQILHLQNSGLSLIAIDSRAQGRSSDDTTRPLTYDAMTLDAIALMDYLNISSFSVVGWSDGGIIGLDLAMNYSSRVEKLFCFGGSYVPSNINKTVEDAPTWKTYMDWVKKDFDRLSPSNGTYDEMSDRLSTMWNTEPVWNATAFQNIPSVFEVAEAPLVWIVDGDSEEAVNRDVPETMFNWIWGSSRVILPGVSHFAFLQDPCTFNAMLDRFLSIKK